MNLKALRSDWAANHRGTGFYLLIALAAFSSMLLLSLGRLRNGFFDINRYFSIYQWILILLIPLSQLRGWAWLRSREIDLFYFSLPLSDRTLSYQIYFSGFRDLLWLLIPVMGCWIGLPLKNLHPGELILSMAGLFFWSALLLSFNQMVQHFSRGPAGAFLLSAAGGIVLFLMLAPSSWSLAYWFAGYLRGDSLLFYLLLPHLFLGLESLAMGKKRQKGWSS